MAALLLELQRRAYAAEARLIGDDRIPGLHESLDDLRAAPLTWLVVVDDAGLPLAAAAVRADGHVTDVDRLLVEPSRARRSLGSALLAAVLGAAAADDRTVTVSTARENRPARRLYEHLGFRHLDDVEAVPRLWVSRYRWSQRRCARVLCLDRAGSVLLMSWRDPVDQRLLHEPPGGGLEPGESALQAARRELVEETGLPGSSVLDVSVQVPRDYRWAGRRHVALEVFFLARLSEARPAVVPADMTDSEMDTFAGPVWQPRARLGDLAGELQPPGLGAVLEQLLTGG